MLSADLHMHSAYSDGTLPIKKLMDYAKSKRLDIIAITDHDSTEGVEEAIAYGKEINIRVIPALELSTEFEGESVHVLGYFRGEIPEEIKQFSKEQHRFRRERIYKMAQNMEALYGFKINEINSCVKEVLLLRWRFFNKHILKFWRLKNECSVA